MSDFTLIEEAVLDHAIRVYGRDAQIDLIIEECTELIHALQKYKRDPSPDRRLNVNEEIGDVKIMIHQAEKMFEKFKIRLSAKMKIKRLEDRISKTMEDNNGKETSQEERPENGQATSGQGSITG